MDNKIYFLEDILDEMVKDGWDKEQARAAYLYFKDELLNDIKTTDTVAYKLGSLGSLFFTISSIHNIKNRAVKLVNHAKKWNGVWHTPTEEKKLAITMAKIDRINKLTQAAIDRGMRRILWFRTRFNPITIKNEPKDKTK